jgi:hypothetical protein
MADPQPPTARRKLGRWIAVACAALALLGLSQALWQWQTWPVRQLLHASAGAAR